VQHVGPGLRAPPSRCDGGAGERPGGGRPNAGVAVSVGHALTRFSLRPRGT
jgi:hypothetical protein